VFVVRRGGRYCKRTMTITAEHSILRAVVVSEEDTEEPTHSACRLLSGLGHEVNGVSSLDEAMKLLSGPAADLLVIDLPTADQKRRLFEQLAALPTESTPRRVAVFSDGADEFTHSLSHQPVKSRVQVFIKPLHLHGLLNVLRNIDGRNLAGVS